ncbi:cytochrome c-type biogenesis protein CcmH [Thalassococcus halodurans]|uniref:Cytochrome c-type biogenesis protein n=1 Tax=Thalassococcus halodurans TaxID=373675 RepID=A0A1H5S8B3_9RHOB|nr:cytochrome c-type biogenesis protein [Thalassococcus halodurans]SEF46057.1 cytochrome c-type biogenesis protein CcmH [Thalassococcus halodurans]
MKQLVLILSLLLSATFVSTGPAWAVLPDEVLDDPVLEERAREISKGLRCLVCQNESIDESNAPLARDLRIVVRERLVAGDTNDEVVEFIVERYGEFALLNPTTDGWNRLLWWAGPAMFLIALLMGALYVRGRAAAPVVDDKGLSDSEQERLNKILND